MTIQSNRRVMGELIFVDGREEAEAIGAELRAARLRVPDY
jgi:hypothetical protein